VLLPTSSGAHNEDSIMFSQRTSTGIRYVLALMSETSGKRERQTLLNTVTKMD
jgi:hypothetical protein